MPRSTPLPRPVPTSPVLSLRPQLALFIHRCGGLTFRVTHQLRFSVALNVGLKWVHVKCKCRWLSAGLRGEGLAGAAIQTWGKGRRGRSSRRSGRGGQGASRSPAMPGFPCRVSGLLLIQPRAPRAPGAGLQHLQASGAWARGGRAQGHRTRPFPSGGPWDRCTGPGVCWGGRGRGTGG